LNKARNNQTTPASLEFRLLLQCGRTDPSPSDRAAISGCLSQQPDPAELVRLAQQHRIVPLVCHCLEAVEDDPVRHKVLAALQPIRNQIVCRNLFLAGELGGILRLLASHGIPALTFKGAALALSAYGGLALRQFSDLDLLVRPRDFCRAKNLLLQHGHRPAFPTSSDKESRFLAGLSGRREEAYLRSVSEYHLIRDRGAVDVDLHQHLTDCSFCFGLDLDSVWARLQDAGRTRAGWAAMSPEDLLLILCVHGAKDCWERLDRMCDVSECLRAHPDLDWDCLLAEAGKTGTRRILLLGVGLAHDLLARGIPAEVQDRIAADRAVQDLLRAVAGRWSMHGPETPPLTKVQREYFHQRVSERWRDRVHFALHRLAPTVGDWAFVPLPPALHFLYYFIRPIRLLWEYGLGRTTARARGNAAESPPRTAAAAPVGP
jgi:hypothetical protein